MRSLISTVLAKRNKKAIRDPRVLMLRNQRGALLVNSFNGVLTTLLLMKSTAALWVMPVWLCTLFLVNAMRWITGTMELKAGQSSKKSDLPVILTGACGITWATLPFLIQPAIDPVSVSIVAFLVAGMTAGAAISNASDPKSVLAFVIPPITSLALFYISQPAIRDKSMALFLVLYCIALISWSKRMKQTIDEANRHSKESREALNFIAAQTKAMRERMVSKDTTSTGDSSLSTSSSPRRAS